MPPLSRSCVFDVCGLLWCNPVRPCRRLYDFKSHVPASIDQTMDDAPVLVLAQTVTIPTPSIIEPLLKRKSHTKAFQMSQVNSKCVNPVITYAGYSESAG